MRILFTGASSFTGFWLVSKLAAAGHDVSAIYQRHPEEYEGVRRDRVLALAPHCEQLFGISFGSDAFLDIVKSEAHWDLLCHHAADVTDYRSEQFDYAHALGSNTTNIANVLDAMGKRGCQRIALTGSVFEGGEGAGSDDLPAFSAYGLSKELTGATFRYFAKRAEMHLGKFVIPNPFGPLEEPRFTAYLIRCWANGDVAEVKTPDYVRDNIHVDLLAKAYVGFSTNLPTVAGFSKLNPSGYVETQGQFATRFADNMRDRLKLSCALSLADQQDFPEPRIRINTDPAESLIDDWQESDAWNEIAEFYRTRINKTSISSSAAG